MAMMNRNILGLRIQTTAPLLVNSTPNIYMNCATPPATSLPIEMFSPCFKALSLSRPRSAGLPRQLSPNVRQSRNSLRYLNLSPAKGLDRFIPSRMHNDFELSSHNLFGDAPASLLARNPEDALRRSPMAKDVLAFNKVLCFSSPKRTEENQSQIDLSSHSPRESKFRRLPNSADNVLDAPGIANNFFLNAIDWGASGCLAAALENRVYIWNPESQKTDLLLECEVDNEMSGVLWNKEGTLLVVTMRNGLVKLWGKDKKYKGLVTKHAEYVTSTSWNKNILSSGDALGNVHHTDVMKGSSSTIKLKPTNEIISGLAWSPNGKYLAIGISDGSFELWEGLQRRLLIIPEFHVAAIKGIAWCPWNSRILVTGGGMKDQKIRIWTMEKYPVSSVEDISSHAEDTHSQICDIAWPANRKEIITCHGSPDFKIAFWKYPSLALLGQIAGHLERVLSLTLSHCGQMLVSASADETIRIWKCFPTPSKDDRKQKHILGISIR